MRFALSLGVLALLLSGCATPNNPTQTLESSKTPEDYAHCVFPKVQKAKSVATLSGSQNHYKIVAGSKVAADDIIEIHKSTQGSKVSLYERAPITSPFGTALEKAARACL
jgi:hypothetical protein